MEYQECPMCGKESVISKPVDIIKMVSKAGVGFDRLVHECEAGCGKFIMAEE